MMGYRPNRNNRPQSNRVPRFFRPVHRSRYREKYPALFSAPPHSQLCYRRPVRPPSAFRRLASLALLCSCAQADPPSWTLARTSHFELYSQAPERQARTTLLWFEQLRAFFTQQTGVDLDHPSPVRIIAFRSAAEYQPYRRGPSSDAYYVGSPTRDTIVMASGDANEFRTAAHEYAHLILRASGLHHPSWLNEGLAQFFSTVNITDRGSTLGSDLIANSQALRRRTWMPLQELLAITGDSPFLEDRNGAELFYSESWLLAEMLVLSPAYGPHFRDLLAALTLQTPGEKAIATIYGKSAADLTRDLRIWAGDRRRFTPVALPGLPASDVPVTVSAVSTTDSRWMLADLALATGDLDRAETLYRSIASPSPANQSPPNAELSAAFGIVAFQKGDRETARREWKRAIDLGIKDASLCYRYAILAEDASVPSDEVRQALQRAVDLQPDYDDARYKLALLEKNAGHYDTAAKHLLAMRKIAPARAFGYWNGLADALNELGRREEAQSAASRAATFAITPAEKALAAQLAYIAQTDLTVGFASDSSGHQRLVTKRIPHDASNFNPFIEPTDDVHRAQGTLREIDCASQITRLVLDVSGQRLTLTIPDPSRVQMRNAPPEFTCGPQNPAPVSVEYTAAGIIRGLQFQ
jgi:tetratricopeptide (TPR) repeat protein